MAPTETTRNRHKNTKMKLRFYFDENYNHGNRLMYDIISLSD